MKYIHYKQKKLQNLTFAIIIFYGLYFAAVAYMLGSAAIIIIYMTKLYKMLRWDFIISEKLFVDWRTIAFCVAMGASWVCSTTKFIGNKKYKHEQKQLGVGFSENTTENQLSIKKLFFNSWFSLIFAQQIWYKQLRFVVSSQV